MAETEQIKTQANFSKKVLEIAMCLERSEKNAQASHRN